MKALENGAAFLRNEGLEKCKGFVLKTKGLYKKNCLFQKNVRFWY